MYRYAGSESRSAPPTQISVIESKPNEVESVETEKIESRDINPAVENTMKQMLRQMDVLTNTVSASLAPPKNVHFSEIKK